MTLVDTRRRLLNRVAAAGIEIPEHVVDGLLTYFELLARWNRRINLTAFNLTEPSDEAIDRLLVEPLAGGLFVRREDRRALDIGSGGGSPAVPLTLAAPWIEMTMVEVRAKKAAFLREVGRTLPVALRVECTRVEDLAASGEAGSFDVVSFRAVRADQGLWAAVDALLGSSGRVLWFGGDRQVIEYPGFSRTASSGTLAIIERSIS